MGKHEKLMGKIRNFGIMAHIDAGKTTVTERMLYITGKIYKIGEVHEGTATMDWMEQEKERGITITSAVTSFEWKGCDFHLIDTPGHVDFTIEVERSLRVLDGVIAVFDGVHGVETQSETVWMQADKFKIPRIAFINKLDRIGASFERSLKSLEEHFSQTMLPMQVPVGIESDFQGVVDLLTMKKIIWNGQDPTEFEVSDDLDDELREYALKYREILFERISDHDDEFCELFLGGEEISQDFAIEKIRNLTLKNRAVPVFMGAALRNKGIQPLMDAVKLYLPSPLDIPPVVGQHPKTGEIVKRNHSPSDPLCALIFKVMIMEDGRRMSFLRIYSGTLHVKDTVYNASKNIKEKISRIFLMHSNHRKRVDVISAGNIFSVLGLKESMTGDTICDESAPIVLEPIGAYTPVIKMVVEPAKSSDRKKLDEVLKKFKDEDPTFNYYEDEETGQTIIEGMGELHLEVICDRMKTNFNLDILVGKPQVVYMETITKEGAGEALIDRKTDEGHLFAGVKITARPAERGKGIVVNVSPDISDIKEEVIEVIKEGIMDSVKNGPVSGYEVTDVEFTINEITLPQGEVNPIAFKIATSMAVEEALSKAEPVLLEPLMNLDVTVSDEFLGAIISDIQSRKGDVVEITEIDSGKKIVRGLVPFRNLIGYAVDVRSLTQGKVSFSIKFAKYDIMRG